MEVGKKAYSLLKMFFKQLYQEGAIPNNPMAMIDMTKKDNYLAAQNKESKPQCDLVVVFTDEELEKIKAEAFKRFANGKPIYQQSAAYFLMLNTGLRAGELCGIINSDIDLENRVIHHSAVLRKYTSVMVWNMFQSWKSKSVN